MNGTTGQTDNVNPAGAAPAQDATAQAAGQGARGLAAPAQAYVAPAPQPGAVRPADPRAKSPAMACILSAMPGLGQVYVGYYLRGFVHVLVAASLFSFLVNSGHDDEPVLPLLVIFLLFFWLYNIIDAGRRAAMYNEALAGNDSIELPKDFKMPGLGGSIAGGALIVVAGFIALLHTRFDVSLEWIAEWWPMAAILFGAWLLVKGIQERTAAGES